MKRWFKRRRLLLLTPLAVAALIWYALPWVTTLPEGLFSPVPLGRIYRAEDGTPLRHHLNDKDERVCAPVALEGLPEILIQATLAAEDKRFWTHGGVDAWAISRALKLNVQRDRIVSGASTITQQLIKVATASTAKRTLTVKATEALQARRLEMQWTKQQILTDYLNRISYGNQFVGCAAAAQGYFNKPLKHLTPAEAAFLAAIPQSPARLNPFRNPKAVNKRKKLILDRMMDLKMLDADAYDLARGQRIVLQRFLGGFSAPHATELDRITQAERQGEIPTTIDARLQAQVETIVCQRLLGLRERNVDHAAVVVIENATRKVLALVGSRDFEAADGGQINGAWTPRSPGSALKPFTYSLAFEAGANPATLVADLPIEYTTSTGLYRPENYDHKHYGPITYRHALGNSLNIAAVRVLDSVGGPAELLKRLRQLGLSSLTEEPEHYGLGLTIGNAPVRLIELTNAYATLASLGEHQPWRLRADESPGEKTRVVEESAAWLLADILSDNQARVLTFGPHSILRLPFRVAVKTGTSTSYRDNWTLGFTPEFTVGVWAGNFEGEPMSDVSGVTGAGPIFRDVFEHLLGTRGVSWYKDPTWVVRLRIDPRTGKRLVPNSPSLRVTRSEVFHKDCLPIAVDPSDYERGTGKAILSSEYARWVDSHDNWLHGLVTTDVSKRVNQLKIVSPTAGSVIVLDPDIPGGGRLLLKAEPGEKLRWICDTLRLQQEGALTYALMQPGKHTLAVVREGESTRVTFEVKAPVSPTKNKNRPEPNVIQPN